MLKSLYKKAQGLPMSTIIIIILVIIVLVAVGIFFFTQFGTGAEQAGAGSGIAQIGIKNLTDAASKGGII